MPLVKIDRSTIRRNPNAGRTSIPVVGMEHGSLLVRFTCAAGEEQEKFDCYSELLRKKGCMLTAWKYKDSSVRIEVAFLGGIDARDLCQAIEDRIEADPTLVLQGIVGKLEQYVRQSIPILPKPDFLFSWVDTEVECSECGEKFPFKELESDGDYYTWSDQVCPKCGFLDCCDLEFEKLTPEMIAQSEEKCGDQAVVKSGNTFSPCGDSEECEGCVCLEDEE